MKIKAYKLDVKDISFEEVVVEWRSKGNKHPKQTPRTSRTVKDMKKDFQKIYKKVLEKGHKYDGDWSILNNYKKHINKSKASRTKVEGKLEGVVAKKFDCNTEEASQIVKSAFVFDSPHAYNYTGSNGDLHEALSDWCASQRTAAKSAGKQIPADSIYRYVKKGKTGFSQFDVINNNGVKVVELHVYHFVNQGHWTSCIGKAIDQKLQKLKERVNVKVAIICSPRFEAKNVGGDIVDETFKFRKDLRDKVNRWNSLFGDMGCGIDFLFDAATLKGLEPAGSFRNVAKVGQGGHEFVSLRRPLDMKNYKASDFIK